MLGSIAAIGIFNLKARSRKAIGFVNSIPILNGDIITGISLFLLFVSLGITQGYTTVVLAHITFCTPYVVLSVLPRLKQMNPNIYEAALDLGATPMQALRKVIIPEIRPGMISGFMLSLIHIYFPTWSATEWKELYFKYFNENFWFDQSNPKIWEAIYNVPDEEIWKTRMTMKNKLVDYIRKSFRDTWLKNQGEDVYKRQC